MFILPEELNDHIASTETEKDEKSTSKSERSQSSISQIYLLQAVLECFVDGILIVTTERELLHTNESARQLCRQITQGKAFNHEIPQEIWRLCQSLIDSSKLYPKEKIFIESEIDIERSVKLRIRIKWLQLSNSDRNFLLVTLEDGNQTSQGIALADAKKYGLTDREAEVWLLRRANFSYKEIAAHLYIIINTVKKHLKNIYAKQQEMLWS